SCHSGNNAFGPELRQKVTSGILKKVPRREKQGRQKLFKVLRRLRHLTATSINSPKRRPE
ncbi:MAG: hypothetical protein M0P18_01195, partial [Syntrophales bacterium]|nr:hypothetical protein [Syntrophales bacterium]